MSGVDEIESGLVALVCGKGELESGEGELESEKGESVKRTGVWGSIGVKASKQMKNVFTKIISVKYFTKIWLVDLVDWKYFTLTKYFIAKQTL